MSKLNLPNKLTLLRIVLIPVFMLVLLLPLPWSDLARRLVGAAVFGLTALTDMFDGKIARKRGLITDFGKFLDPLADKFMIFGALLTLLVIGSYPGVLVWVTAVIMFRELAVTSLRLVVVGASGKVIAANMAGKMKTVSQIVGVLVMILEPVTLNVLHFWPENLLSYLMMALMTVTTLWSGFTYFKASWSYIDPAK